MKTPHHQAAVSRAKWGSYRSINRGFVLKRSKAKKMLERKRLLSSGILVLLFVLCAGFIAGQTQESVKLLKKVDPVYPDLAQKMNLRGTVKVEILIVRDGSVQNVTVLGGHPVLAVAVTDAVKQWRYSSSSQETKKTLEFKF